MALIRKIHFKVSFHFVEAEFLGVVIKKVNFGERLDKITI